MKNLTLKAAGLALAFSFAAPVLAQAAATAPAAAPAAPARPAHAHKMMMFKSMSPAGQAIMRDAMKAGDPRTTRATVRAARDRMMALLGADKLDVPAMKRAMEDERKAAEALRSTHQAAMLTAFQKLSLADRKAFVADATAMRSRMEMRMGRRGGHGGMDGMEGMDDMPPQM